MTKATIRCSSNFDLLPWQRNLGYFAKISNCFFFFVFRWNRAIFSSLVLREPLYKTLFFEIWAQAHITRLVWQMDRRCLHLPWGFRGWPIQWNHAKCCGADPCCHGNEIWANLGYFTTKSPMSRLVCQIDQICLGLPAETTSGADLCCQGNDI